LQGLIYLLLPLISLPPEAHDIYARVTIALTATAAANATAANAAATAAVADLLLLP
jgi:hypothetical protein